MPALERLKISQQLENRKKYSKAQGQTRDTFGFKWAKRDTYDSPATKANSLRWLLERYCENDPSLLDKWLGGGRKLILDAGCGAGYSAMLLFGDHLRNHDYLGVDISNAVNEARVRFQEAGYPADFLQRSLMDLDDVPVGSVDLLFSEGVLHHTDSTEQAFKYLARKLSRGGRFLCYVYAKKAVIREFTDDHIRQQLKASSDEEAWRALESLTKLGMALGELKVEIDIPEDIPYLDIKKGKFDLQRFFYWNICKLYYRPEFTLDEMNHINFDWFRPLNCHRHTPEEISAWCDDTGLEIERLNVQAAGITIVARRPEGC
jgi:arsenite methyltransferase